MFIYFPGKLSGLPYLYGVISYCSFPFNFGTQNLVVVVHKILIDYNNLSHIFTINIAALLLNIRIKFYLKDNAIIISQHLIENSSFLF